MIRAIPNINTSRLTLRAMRAEDFDRFADLWASPIVGRHAAGGPLSRSRAWGVFLRVAGHWHMTGFGEWAIEDRTTRQIIGQAGFRYSVSDLGADFDAYPEASVLLLPDMLDQRFGLEAMTAAHDWFDRVITGPLVARVRDGDGAGAAVAARLGYARLRVVEDGGGPVLLLRRNSPPVR
ncbi:GNAT family N-acetyltransferase [Marinibacterium profundimaris]|uniref:Acetyltransferase n=1 Tax=Marinibacterium profundimaris TaxID=1679460 RepID=A0A225NRQ4_9RHOB|nr:GNAT family N-acetyltransferase [Marinibacterium profundimaris]OWU77525.1 acetyltransferase [Marinibacterium profundimaris]